MRPGDDATLEEQARANGLADRILLCIPLGGLNDTLCQIARCLNYAKRFDRQLVIDARRSGLMGQFSDYFDLCSPKVEVIGEMTAPILSILNAYDCYPAPLQGRIEIPGHYRSRTVYVDGTLDVPASFDFSRDYPHKLLVHEQCGGGNRSHTLLQRLVLADAVRAIVKRRLEALPSEYLGVHVRNTDLKTDYKSFFQDIYPSTVGKSVLICSDNTDVIDYARKALDRSSVITTIQDGDGAMRGMARLHDPKDYENDADKRTQAVNSLVDLLALGGASDVLVTKCLNKNIYSGFSRLASYLCENSHLVTSLLSSPMPQFQIKKVKQELAEAKQENQRLRGDFSDTIRLRKAHDAFVRYSGQLETAYQKLLNSRSWKIAAPYRVMGAMFQRALGVRRPLRNQPLSRPSTDHAENTREATSSVKAEKSPRTGTPPRR